MKKSEIKVGGHYQAKVSGRLVTVRVDAIRERTGYGSSRDRTVFDVTNLTTNRKTTFESAMKFRGVVDPNQPARRPLKTVLTFPGDKDIEMKEDEQRSDPQTTTSAELTSSTVASASPTSQVKSGLSSLVRKSQPQAPHLIVEARAGTGKTTTLIEGLRRLKGVPTPGFVPSPQQQSVFDSILLSQGQAQSICFVAFNKSIADELKRRVPEGCDAMTMHSMGLKAVTRAFGRVRIESDRTKNLISEILEKDLRELRRNDFEMLRATEQLVDLCKMNLTEPTEENLDKLAGHYEVELNGDRSKVFDLVPRVLERAKDVQRDNCIDFADMIWIPVVRDLQLWKYDLLLVDESQDLNRCQQSLAKKAGKRLILVGDPKQAIYGFAGADNESMKHMEKELGGGWIDDALEHDYPEANPKCVTLPLTVTRRCGRAIVEEAKKIVPDFEAYETNGEGAILRMKMDAPETKVTDPSQNYINRVQDGDMILCRCNAPLVSQCFRFLKAGRKANIQGRNIGQGLTSTINKMKAHDIPELLFRLSDWLHEEQRKENAKRNPSESRLISLQDRYDCLQAFCEGAKTVDEVLEKIDSVFTDQTTAGIRLSSIHKAKGLEADRVFLLEPKGCTVPHPMAKSPWQKEQEWNLRYVAVTRAIKELVFVS